MTDSPEIVGTVLVKITPEMIEAGLVELLKHGDVGDALSEEEGLALIEAVLRAALGVEP